MQLCIIPCNINVNVATARTNELPLAQYTDNVCTEIARFPRTSVNDFVTLYEGNLIRQVPHDIESSNVVLYTS